MSKRKNFPSSAIYLVRRLFSRSARALGNGAFRSTLIAQLRHGKGYGQQETFTLPDRYPVVFAACASYLLKKPTPRILSYGCSTGEEVFTLADYVPHAIITGVDINEWCLSECNRKDINRHFTFLNSYSDDFKAAANFDAIFCMAVFQRTENRTASRKIAKGFTFDQFAHELNLLDGKLNNDGLLVIDNTDFSFADWPGYKRYQHLSFEGNLMMRRRPQYGPDNIKRAEVQKNYRVFVKKAPIL